MAKKPGRNDPCSCGSGKKYKQCCMGKPLGSRKIQAKWLNPKQKMVDLMDRTFGEAIDTAGQDEAPPLPPMPPPGKKNEE